MSWVRLEDTFPEHPKILSVDPEAAWLFVQGLCYANRNLTDGLIPKRAAVAMAGAHHTRLIAQLVSSRLWESEREGYRIHDYHEYQPTRQAVLVRRESDRNRKRIRPESERNPSAPYPSRTRTQVSKETGTPRSGEIRPIGEAARRVVEGLR